MFKGLTDLVRNTFLWSSTFDDECRHMSFLSHAVRLLGSRRVDEKKSYWRQHGGRRFTPQEAALQLRDELADVLLEASHTDEHIRSRLGEVAHSIALMAPSADKRQAFQSLPAEWWTIYMDHIAHENARYAVYRDVVDATFSPDELETAWQRLLQPDMPDAVRRLWGASWERTHVADLVKTTGLTARDMALWMRVLVDHDLGRWPCRMFQGFQHKLSLPDSASKDVRRVGGRLGLE